MPALTQSQRVAILQRYGGLVRTYFSQAELREIRFADQPRLDAEEVEFYSYLRLSTVLAAGRRLPEILGRIILAPSLVQERVLVDSRGRIEGQLDMHSYARLRGRVATPRVFPNWRVRTNHATPENALAMMAGRSMLSELQRLASRLPLKASAEERLTMQITEATEELLRSSVLGEALRLSPPDITSAEAEGLFVRVAERLRTRRISNLAYADLWRWAHAYRRRGLGLGELTGSLAYSEEFDNRLFEIFSLARVRDALRALGFEERVVRPLHERGKGAVLEVVHSDAGLDLSVFFQKSEGLLWNEDKPREWERIGGIPDIVLRPRSTRHPIMIIDAKNRFRGDELQSSVTEELYKMLGYFQNFSRSMRIQDRGPIGGLIFRSSGGTESLQAYDSRSGGALRAVALDPCRSGNATPDGARLLLEELLRYAGFLGGRPAVAEAVSDLKEALGTVAVGEEDTDDEDGTESEILERMHELVAAEYGTPGTPLQRAKQSLELHVLGSTWEQLDKDVQTMLATGEVFWAEHHFAFGMDFAPVVVELSRSTEIVLESMVFGPFRQWASERGQASGAEVLTLGQMRALIEGARDVAGGARARGRPEVVSLHGFLESHGLTSYAYTELLEDIKFVNLLRRRAAHKDMVTSSEAAQLRERVLGVGSASPIMARMVREFFALRRI